MAKVEVQIRSCFCCGLSVASIAIAIYTLILYLLLTGAAGWGLSETTTNGDSKVYNKCELEAQGRIAADRLAVRAGQTRVEFVDTSSYHCSLGLYTEEYKFSASPRYTLLLLNVFLYISIVLASLILIIGLCIYNQWLLVPWILLMAIDIVRGFFSVFFIFWYSYGNLARIATGIFFLGLQCLHISLLLIIVAKFQRIHNRRNGIPEKTYDARVAASRAASSYGYGEPRHDFYPETHRPYPHAAYDNQPYRY